MPEKFKSEIDLNFLDAMLFYLSEGDPGRLKALRKSKEKDVNDYYYLRRVEDLNRLYDHIAHIKYLKDKQND